jgi:branched-chain amino acid transport system permease protein
MTNVQTSKEESRSSSTSVFRKIGLVRKGNHISPLLVLVGLVIASLYPSLLSENTNSLIEYTPYLMWIVLAEAWNLAGGYAGLLNLGFVAFFGLGAFTTGFAMTEGVTLGPALLVAGISGGMLALILVPTFRLRSDYFAIGTLVIPFMLKPIVEAIFPRSTFHVPASEILSPIQLYYLGLIIVGVIIFGIYIMMRSRIGIALRAIGDQETAALSLGVNAFLYKTFALALSGFLAAVAGGYFIQNISVDSTIFENLTYSLFPIFMVIIGGIGTFEGPIVGAVLFSAINYELDLIFPGSSYGVLLFSIIIMLVAVLVPRGIVPAIIKYWERIRL